MILLVSITNKFLGLPSPVPYIWTIQGCAAQYTFCLVHSMIFSLPQTALLYTVEQGLFSPQHHYHTLDEKFCFPHCLVTVQQTGYFVLCGVCCS